MWGVVRLIAARMHGDLARPEYRNDVRSLLRRIMPRYEARFVVPDPCASLRRAMSAGPDPPAAPGQEEPSPEICSGPDGLTGQDAQQGESIPDQTKRQYAQEYADDSKDIDQQSAPDDRLRSPDQDGENDL